MHKRDYQQRGRKKHIPDLVFHSLPLFLSFLPPFSVSSRVFGLMSICSIDPHARLVIDGSCFRCFVDSKKKHNQIESAPVNIPSSRSLHHRHSGHFKRSPQAAGSLHHSQYVHGHHRHQHHHHHHQPHHNHSNSHRKSSSRRQGGLASSLPHSSHMSAAARGEDPYSQSRQPTRPNTGTEDNDEQFLRMEAQLSNLIAEGKRALGSEIPDWRKFPSGSTIY